MDPYGALINSLGFQVGIGLYVARHADSVFFLYLIIGLLFLKAGEIFPYASREILRKLLSKEPQVGGDNGNKQVRRALNVRATSTKYFDKAQKIFSDVLDDRARSVDLICLLILIETYTNTFFTWIVFIAFFIKALLRFLGEMYLVLKKDWIGQIEGRLNLWE